MLQSFMYRCYLRLIPPACSFKPIRSGVEINRNMSSSSPVEPESDEELNPYWKSLESRVMKREIGKHGRSKSSLLTGGIIVAEYHYSSF